MLQVLEVPVPAVSDNEILIRNHYTLISPGTEGGTVKTARKGYIGKAKDRPQQFQQVLSTLREKGPVQTYRAVMSKLDAYSPLGYSCAGEVIEVGRNVIEFVRGDLVAGGGLQAAHAEVVAVPANLCVKLEPAADMSQAVYNTLGAIAMQGVRQADLRLGETCVVIGLGLVGQLTCLLLKASGVKVVGIDIDENMVERARTSADLSLNRNSFGVEKNILEFCNGYGSDAVIITASSDSLDPINFAGAVSRQKGTVVVVGAVPTGFNREPDYYKKELSVRMSCSYGPGRYDPEYEEKGRDYPYGYVRWTEKRNMQAFQDLIAKKAIDVGHLTTHVFTLKEAPEAYNLILKKAEPSIGILIKYDRQLQADQGVVTVSGRVPSKALNIGFIGAGSYAQNFLLPAVKAEQDLALKGVITTSSNTARSVADRYGFEFCSCDPETVLDNNDINVVFIATRHDSHGRYVTEALKRGKNVFVEKPLCLTHEEYLQISELAARPECPSLVIGFNRRFSTLTGELKRRLPKGPCSMNYQINAGSIPHSSWIQDRETGGGRILGEVCHFIDYLSFLNGGGPSQVHSFCMADPMNDCDTVLISLKYANGSIGSVHYFSNGPKGIGKEKIEVYSDGCRFQIDDFHTLNIASGGETFKKRLLAQDKGQKYLVHQFLRSIKEGLSSPLPVKESLNSTLVTFLAIESMRTGQAIQV